MQRTLRKTSAHSKQKTPRSKKLANSAIIGSSAAVVLGLSVAVLQGQHALARNAEAAAAYSPAVTYTAPPDAPTVAFIGDSFTAGTGSTDEARRWTSVVAKEQGWNELNFGIGGSSFIRTDDSKPDDSYPSQVPDVIKARPDIVIVSTAVNALNEDQGTGIDETFDTLRDGLPKARIIATSPYFRASGITPEHEEKGQQIEEAVESVDGEYLDINDPLKSHPEGMADDGAHPNDVGHKLIADAVLDALR